MRITALRAAAASLVLCACGSSGSSSFGDPGDASSDTGSTTTTDAGGFVGSDASFTLDGAVADAGTPVGEVWAHSAGTLYRLEPFSKVTTRIADFKNCSGSIIDIALDKNGQMYGTTTGSLERIEKTTATCTTVSATDSYPNSLTFVPAGTLDPNVEALVGFEGDQYVRIDPTTGKKSTVGALNPNATGKTFLSSGDVVSIIGDKTYLTVKVTPDVGSDGIIEVDPKTGKALAYIGATKQTDIFGLGYWAGTAYGFTNGGEIFAIDLATGAATNIPIPSPPAGLSFWGAGVTTSAPTMPPK